MIEKYLKTREGLDALTWMMNWYGFTTLKEVINSVKSHTSRSIEFLDYFSDTYGMHY